MSNRPNNKSKFTGYKGIVKYQATSIITLDSKPEKGVSTMKECKVLLSAPPPIEAAWRNDKGELNAEGLKAQTQALIQGLISNIHYGHQFGLRDSADHLRYIIEYLEKGFVHQVQAFQKRD